MCSYWVMGKQALRLSKLFLISAVLGLFFAGASIQDIYAPGPRAISVALVYSGPDGTLIATDKDAVPHIVTNFTPPNEATGTTGVKLVTK